MAQTIGTVSRFAFAAAVLSFAAGCGNNYKPVVSAINPVGPAGQPEKFAVVISNPNPMHPAGASPTPTSSDKLPGLLNFVDFSGDEVLITANVGVNPYYLILNGTGTNGFTLNGDGTLSNFAISTSLLTSQILQTTLLPSQRDATGNLVVPTSIFPQNTYTYVTQPGYNPNNPPITTTPPPTPPGRNNIAEFTSTDGPLALQQELPVNFSFSPIYIAGIPSSTRSYAINPAIDGGPGQVATIENTTPNASIDPNPLTVGRGPVYGVMTADGRRVFIMNQTDGTVSVINAQTNLLDVVPAGASNPIQVGTAPLWADFAPTRNELIVANAGDGVNPGSLSIISIPLCSPQAQPNNPTCDPNNPVDATGFGTVLANVPVGVNPRMVGVLQDGTRAYVVNQGNSSIPCGPATASQPANCTVSVVNLTTNTVTATIPIPVTSPSTVANGHPNYIAVTTGTPTGKVYVTSPESTSMTVINTDTDSVDTTVPLQGFGVSVRVTAP